MKEERKTRNPFGIVFDAITTEEFISYAISAAHEKNSLNFITYLNAHCVNIYFRDPQYAQIINRADLVYADGQAVIWASRFLGEPLPERISAGDFFMEFCRKCVEEDLSLFLLGSAPKVAEKAMKNIRAEVPGIKFKGACHGYFQKEKTAGVLATIKEAAPDILLVGMGVPIQEKFARNHLTELNVPVTWCVGALFEYFAGETPRAPRWIRRIGMEWLFRLTMEPRRLWKRYLLGNLCFIGKTLRARLKNKK